MFSLIPGHTLGTRQSLFDKREGVGDKNAKQFLLLQAVSTLVLVETSCNYCMSRVVPYQIGTVKSWISYIEQNPLL